LATGKKARFWHHAWLDGEAPRNLSPQLFELVQRKNKTTAQELANNSWISALQNKITNTTQLEEFVSLWIRIQGVFLNSEIEDSSLGNGHQMALILHGKHIELSSSDLFGASTRTLSGVRGLKTSVKCLHGFSSKKKS